MGWALLSNGEKVTLAEVAHCLGRMALEDVAAIAKPDMTGKSTALAESSGRKSHQDKRQSELHRHDQPRCNTIEDGGWVIIRKGQPD